MRNCYTTLLMMLLLLLEMCNYFIEPSGEVADVEPTPVRPALFFLVVSAHLSAHRFYSGMPSECPSHPVDDVAGHWLQQPALYPV